MGLSARTSWGAPMVVALTCALAAFAATPVVVGVAVPAPAGAESPAARSAGVDGAVAALTRLRVVDHNIEKRTAAMKRAFKAARRSGADVITLQEVCWWQAANVRRTHPEWTIAYKAERDNDRCRRRGHSGDTLGTRRHVGNLAIWTGGPDGSASTDVFTPQRFTGDSAGLACVTWLVTVRHRACSVHLISPTEPADVKVRTAQARDIRRITAPWIAADDLVVLAGDFNAQPQRQTMKHIYEFQGRGEFREASSRRLGGPDCRCTQPTYDGKKLKIDYIFYSANRIEPRAFRSIRVVRTVSDHHLLVGWADVDASVR